MSDFDQWKNKLDQYKSPVSEKVWAGVETALVASRRRRRFFLIWLIGILCIGIIGVKKYTDFNNSRIIQDDLTEPQLYALEKDSEKILPIIEVRTLDNQEVTDNVLSTSTKSIPKHSENVRSESQSKISTQQKKTATREGLLTSKSADDIQNMEVIALSAGLNQIELEKQNDERLISWKMENIATLSINSIEYKSSTPIMDRCDLPDPPIGCPKLNKRSRLGGGLSKWAFDITYGPGYPLRRLIAKSAEFGDYLDLRNDNESSVYEEMVQARISYISKWGIAGRTGINYGHLVEKLAFTRDSVIGSSTVITIDTLFNSDGTYNITVDTTNVITAGRLEKVKYNHFTTFQIPIILGYEHRVKDWTFHVNGGVLMNFSLKKRGEILDPSNQPVDISTSTGTYDAFKDDWGMILYASLGANYRLTDRFHAIIEPSFRYTLNPISTTSYPLEQKFMIMNLNVGLRYEF